MQKDRRFRWTWGGWVLGAACLLCAIALLQAPVAGMGAGRATDGQPGLVRASVDFTPTELVFVDYVNPGVSPNTGLFIADRDGRNRVAIGADAPGTVKTRPSWAPYRRQLTYSAWLSDAMQPGGGRWILALHDLNTGMTRALTEGPYDDASDWKTSGLLLAYVSYFGPNDQPGASVLSLLDPYDPAPQLHPMTAILEDEIHRFGGPSWSPGGRSLAVPIASRNAGSQLYVMRADGTELQRRFVHPGWDDVDVAWSPDERYLAFASGAWSGTSSATRHDLWILDLETGIAGTVATHATYDLRRPAWSPDSTHLIFDAQTVPGRRWELFTVPSTGGAWQGPLTTGFDADWASPNGPFPTERNPTPVRTPGVTPAATATFAMTATAPVVATFPSLPTLPPLPTFPPTGEPTQPGPAPTYPPPPTLTPSPTPTPTATPTSTSTTTPTPRPGPAPVYLPKLENGELAPEPTATATVDPSLEPTATAVPWRRKRHEDIPSAGAGVSPADGVNPPARWRGVTRPRRSRP